MTHGAGEEETSLFVSLEGSGIEEWAPPGGLSFFDELCSVPLSDTELLHMSHYSPIGIAIDQIGPQVVAILHSGLLKAEQVNPEGRWVPRYTPMALRCLPFRPSRQGGSPEIAPVLMDGNMPKLPIFSSPGNPAPEYAPIREMLDRLARGGARLTNAAKLLIAADVLSPLQRLPDRPLEKLFVANADKIRTQPAGRMAALTADDNLAFELAAASLFSLRWLDTRCIDDAVAHAPDQYGALASRFATVEVEAGIDQPVMMDVSELFSIEEFLAATESADDRT